MDSLDRWVGFWTAAGAAGDLPAEHAALAARYGEPGRHYHTMAHVMACLTELDRVRGECAAAAAVEAALWFHDAVHDPRAADNESRSADLLLGAVRRLGVDPWLGNAAAVLVMATAHFAEEPAGEPAEEPAAEPVGGADGGLASDADIARDIDLAVLGRPPGDYAAYREAVRREYAFLTDDQWRAGRTRVLRGFLSRARIYATAALGARYEEQARANLRGELETLTPGRRP